MRVARKLPSRSSADDKWVVHPLHNFVTQDKKVWDMLAVIRNIMVQIRSDDPGAVGPITPHKMIPPRIVRRYDPRHKNRECLRAHAEVLHYQSDAASKVLRFYYGKYLLGAAIHQISKFSVRHVNCLHGGD